MPVRSKHYEQSKTVYLRGDSDCFERHNGLSIQNTKGILRLLAAFAATAVMLTLAQQPIGVVAIGVGGVCAFYSCLLLLKHKHVQDCISPRLLSRHCYWLGNIYWMSFVTVVGWIAFCLYTALLWPLLAIIPAMVH